jgi:hypothetical protein
MEEMCRKHDFSNSRKIFALDTFTGFVSRTDGLDVDIATGKEVCKINTNNIDFSSESINNMQSVPFERLCVVKGDVMTTIPKLETKTIALLRLDTDTYETTKFELEQLYDRVVIGGVVIIDDYGFTVGCKKAVDEFTWKRGIFPQRINRYCRTWVKTAQKTSPRKTPNTPLARLVGGFPAVRRYIRRLSMHWRA